MKLTVLGSGSSGNCYLLHNDNECLVIDAGIAFKEVKKALDFNISKIVGVIVSHVHGDHSKAIKDYEKAGIPVFQPYENYLPVECFGGFSIMPFELVHDVPCYGFLIKHNEIGRMVYVTDTEYIKYRFQNLNHIMVEANYSKEIIERYSINRNHVLNGHMEFETTKEFIHQNKSNELRNVVLLHLSNSNSDEALFQREISNIVTCPVWVANKGLEVELSTLPF